MPTNRTLIALLSSVLLIATSTAVTPVAAQPTDLAGSLDRVIEARIAQLGVPGAIVALDIPGQVSYARAFGVGDTASATPLSVDDHHRIGSVTKTFTGTAVLQLVDQGRIRLSDPIARYVGGVPSGEVITLDLLGRMRSGLPNYTETADFATRLFDEAPLGPDAFAFTPRELVDSAFTEPLKFAPGTQFEYSNTNTVLLGMVVTEVTGMPIGDYLREHVFGPAGLTSTSYPVNGVMPVPYAHGYTESPDGALLDASLWNPSWTDAAGQIVSTVDDLRVWARVVGRGTLLSPVTQAQRLADAGEIVPGAGYAFAIFTTGGWLGHNGGLPGYTTVAVYLPERDATLVVMVNSDAPEPHAAGQLATDITSVATPGHVYELGPQPPLMIDEDS